MLGLSDRLRQGVPKVRVLPKASRPPRGNRRFRPTDTFEPLEPRIALSHATIAVGAIQAGQNSGFSGSVARSSTKDYEFQVNQSMIVGATLSALSSKAELVLLNAAKAPLASFYDGRANDSFTYTFSPGVYYARVVNLGRNKARYALTVTASALPTPPPTPTPTTTPTPTSTAPGSSSEGGSGSNSPKITVEQFATALASVTQQAVHQFALDATAVEALAPTAYSTSVDPELNKVDEDVLNDNDFQAFADLVSLGQTMLQEALFTTTFGLKNTDALLGYSQVVTDLYNVEAAKEITYSFLDYLASKLPTAYTGSTPAYLTTGVLGTGSSGNVLGQTNQSALTEYSAPPLSNLATFYNSNLSGSLPSDNEYSSVANDFSTTEDIQEDNTESVDLGDDVDGNMDDIDPNAGYQDPP